MTQSRNFNSRPAGPAMVIEIETGISPVIAARKLANLPHLCLLESSMRHATLGRYSFVMADPVEWFQPPAKQIRATFDWLDTRLTRFRCGTSDDLPPFQGGIAGLLGYEFNAAIENMSQPKDGCTPVCLGIYDVVIAWDHELNRCWLISQGVPEVEPDQRRRRAGERAGFFMQRLEGQLTTVADDFSESPQAHSPVMHSDQSDRFQCPGHPNVTSNVDRPAYLAMIRSALEYIHAGDIFQVNLAQHLRHPATASSLDLYRRLRECNASTFAGYLDTGFSQIISASPERLVSVRDRYVETRPIKGTRRRTKRPEVDIDIGKQLQACEKDRSENIMIVDLMRNDLSRVCCDDSVRVSQLVELESYPSVLHLVSAVEGQLRDDIRSSDLVKAIFPGGSISGAPKIRAMEIISELENHARGAYCGSLGYFGFDGTIDLNILIRTIAAADGYWHFPVGGGIVADSDPVAEYQETWTKAHGLLTAITHFPVPVTRGVS